MKKELIELINSQKLAVLSTCSNEHPYVNLVAYSYSDDLCYFYFATTRATRKYNNLSQNPEVSLLIDNRSNSIKDFQDAKAVTIIGLAEELNEEQKQLAKDLYLSSHPYLEDFFSSPSSALFKIKVRKFILVTNFQNVFEIKPQNA
ncbi:MAG: pyridoxamine 5'-phosphate oxidase family protein [Armatimonadota bacterium]